MRRSRSRLLVALLLATGLLSLGLPSGADVPGGADALSGAGALNGADVPGGAGALNGAGAPAATDLAGLAFDATTVLVRTDDARAHRLAGVGTLVNRIRPLGIDVVRVPEGSVQTAVARYAEVPAVEWAEPNWRLSISMLPNDPLLEDQWPVEKLRLVEAWQRYGPRWAPPGGGRLAIIDTGIDPTHPEFSAPGKVTHCRSWSLAIGIATSGCLDDNSHGTHVAGIAAALAHNGRGIAGVAPDASLLILKAFGPTGHGFAADVAAAMAYAADHGAMVANYSFGLAVRSAAQAEAVAYAARRGVVQVAAAGNEAEEPVTYPAREPQVIGVSATTSEDKLAPFSARGPGVELAAPGEGILSAIPGTLVYGRMSGTSMAAPHVAGLAVLLRARGVSAGAVRPTLRQGADPVADGQRRINAARTLQLVP